MEAFERMTERDMLRDAAQRRRHIGVRTPGGDGVVDALPVRFDERDMVEAAAGTLEGELDDIHVRLPGAEHFIETVGGEIGDELVDAVGRQGVANISLAMSLMRDHVEGPRSSGRR